MESQNPWIINLGAPEHVSGNTSTKWYIREKKYMLG